MPKALKITLISVLGIVLLFIAAAVVLVATVDPNEYKGEISAQVKKATGRDLTFTGDIEFNFFPWLGLKVGPVALGNAAGFSPADMVRIQRAEASIRILPLLSGDVAIGTVVLDGFTANLAINKQGRTNWDDLAGDKTAEKSEPETPAGTESPSGGKVTDSGLGSLSVEGVEITNAQVVYEDRKGGTKASVSNLNLIIGEVGDKLPTPIRLNLDVELSNPDMKLHPDLTAIATFDKNAGTFRLADLVFKVLDMTISGALFAENKENGINYSGELKLAETSPKALMKKLGMAPIQTADAKALTRLNALIKVNGTATDVSLEDLTVHLDDTTITGTGSVRNFAKPAIRVAVNVDDIDVDRYMSPVREGEKTQKREEKTGQPAKAAQEPDLTGLRDLDLQARLTVGKAKAMNARVTDILTNLVAKNGIITIKPFAATLYDGKLDGQSVLNVNKKVATWKESATLKGVQAGPLLEDMTGEAQILGTTSAAYNVYGAGLTPETIKRTVSGTASFSFLNGAINGVNIAKMIRDAFNAIKGNSVADDEPARTDFAELSGSAVIKRGHITNNDLSMQSPLLRVAGKGWIDLPKNNLDYLTTVKVVGSLKGQGGKDMDDLTGLPIPVYAKGSLESPRFGLDTKALAEALFKNKTKNLGDQIKNVILGGSKDNDSKDDSSSDKEPLTPENILKKLF